MIILDTNVLSALMQESPDLSVLEWLDRQNEESIRTTSITIFEIQTGLEPMPRGKRHQTLSLRFGELLEEIFENRILDFDAQAAVAAARLTADRQRAGKTADVRDVQIAAIAVARRATLATRNLRHFSDLKIPVVNPWTA